jgi:hypothetical protein
MNSETLTISVKGAGQKLALSREQLKVSQASDHRVEWVCDDGTMELRFVGPGEGPFETTTLTPTRTGQVLRAGRLRSGLAPGAKFPYDLVVKKGANTVAELRGVIVIDAGGGTMDSKTVRITVTADRELVVTPDVVRISRKKREQVSWICDDGQFEISFDKDGTPFPEGQYAGTKGAPRQSGKCRADAAKQIYHYSVTVQPTAGGEPITLDPGVDVDDSGTDPR